VRASRRLRRRRVVFNGSMAKTVNKIIVSIYRRVGLCLAQCNLL